MELITEQSLITEWTILKLIIDFVFNAPNDELLNILFANVVEDCKDGNQCVSNLVILMGGGRGHCIIFVIGRIQGIFGLRELSHAESKYVNVNYFVIQNTEGVYGVMQELMKR